MKTSKKIYLVFILWLSSGPLHASMPIRTLIESQKRVLRVARRGRVRQADIGVDPVKIPNRRPASRPRVPSDG